MRKVRLLWIGESQKYVILQFVTYYILFIHDAIKEST